MTYTLYLRDDILPDKFNSQGKQKTYKEAVIEGDKLSGYGNFFVCTGQTHPSRAQQLLEDVTEVSVKRQAKHHLTLTLALED